MCTPVKDFLEHGGYKCESTKVHEGNSEQDILSIPDETKPKQSVNAFFETKQHS